MFYYDSLWKKNRSEPSFLGLGSTTPDPVDHLHSSGTQVSNLFWLILVDFLWAANSTRGLKFRPSCGLYYIEICRSIAIVLYTLNSQLDKACHNF